MWLELELDRLSLSPLRPKGPLRRPTVDEIAVIRKLGFVDPLTVRTLPNTTYPIQYEIVSDEKQWLGAQKAGLATVSVYVRDDLQDEDVHYWQRMSAREGTANPLQEAQALQARIHQGLSVTRAGAERGYPRTVASHLLRLLRLDPAVQVWIAEGKLQVGHAKALVGLKPDQRGLLVQRIWREQLSVRQVEVLVRERRYASTCEFLMMAASDTADQQRLERLLSEQLGVSVKVQATSNGSGQLILGFDTLDVLDGLLKRLDYQEDMD